MTTTTTTAVQVQPTLAIDGTENLELSNRMVEMTITDDQTGLYRCEVQFDNWGNVDGEVGYVLSDRRLVDFGKELSVSYGPDNDQLFTGRIMGIEGLFLADGSRLLRVLVEDKLQDLRMTRRTRHFGGGDDGAVTDEDVINQIAQDHGLTAELDIETVSHKRLAQVNESDLAFLRRRARALDADIWLDEDVLHMVARHRHPREPNVLRYQSELMEFVVLADLAEQRTAVRVSGWDATSKEAVSHEATESAIQSELGDLLSGVSLLGELGKKEVIAHTVALDSSEAEARANAFFRMRARRFVMGTAVVKTLGRYHVGDYVTFRELDVLFDGDYVITRVQHLFDRVGGGMRTELLVERPGIGQ